MEEIPKFREDDEYAMHLKEVGLGNIQNIHGVRNLLYMIPQRSLIPEENHGSTWVADRSVEYIKENGGKRPFFCGQAGLLRILLLMFLIHLPICIMKRIFQKP